MTPTEAAMVIREAMRTDSDLTQVVAAIITRAGAHDLYDWIDNNPDTAILLAESEIATKEVLAIYAEQLKGGALGDRQDNEPST